MDKTNQTLKRTFIFMFLGLLISGFNAWHTCLSNLVIGVMSGMSIYLLFFAEILVVILFDFLYKKLSPFLVGVLYFLYSFLNGLTLSVIFLQFELNSVIMLFLISALVFRCISFNWIYDKK